MTTQDALLAEILANPADDVCRLVYADWLDENGQPERAEFIRVQCQIARIEEVAGCHRAPMDFLIEESRLWSWIDRHGLLSGVPTDGTWCAARNRKDYESLGPKVVLVRRGFVSEVRCTLEHWCGGECQECGGYGDGPEMVTHCQACDGTHRTLGIGPALVRKHPIERVEFTDDFFNDTLPEILTVYRYTTGPLWPLILQRTAYRSAVSRAVVAVSDVPERMLDNVSAAAIEWANGQQVTAGL